MQTHTQKNYFRTNRVLLLITTFLLIFFLGAGCKALMTTVLLITGQDESPAKHKFLKGKTVAIVCLAQQMTDSRYDDVPRDLARVVGVDLENHVKKIEIIPHSKVNRWLDRHERKIEDYTDFGKEMEADMVLAIEIYSFETSSMNSPGSYQGRSSVSFTVYDINGDRPTIMESVPSRIYPPNMRLTSNDLPEAQFRNEYIAKIAMDIGRYFYSYNPQDDVAMDARVGLNHL
ncbi:MAG: hypothetical protein LBJ67_10935 [Planctomycetaceae bacterium]|jgi:hypothetical protein|nr:hypothetical protein [Planctomycetaceae bacterium]